MLFPLVGLFLGLLLALPLAPLVKPLVPKLGLPHPLWSVFLPPVIIFLLVEILFVGVGFFGHARVRLFYRNRTDDVHRTRWERLNQHLGVPVGLLAAAIYLVMIGLAVHVLGYLTVQVSSGDNEPAVIRYLNQAREEMESSGLSRIAAALDPAPPRYYEAADTLGFLYCNSPLHSRLGAYPPFIALAEKEQFQEIATDTEFIRLLSGQPSLQQVLQHPRMQAILSNPEVLSQLQAIDLKDLVGYLRTGVSEKYSEPPALGRWEVDPYLTFLDEKRRRRDMKAADVRLLRYEMQFVQGFKLFVAPDNTVRLKGPDISKLMKQLQTIAESLAQGAKPRASVITIPQATTPPPSAPPSGGGGRGQVTGAAAMTRQMAERYGVQPTQAPPAPPPEIADPSAPVVVAPAGPMTLEDVAAELAKLPLVTLAEGTWKEENGRVVFNLKGTKRIERFVGTGKADSIETSIREERLVLRDRNTSRGERTLVMVRF